MTALIAPPDLARRITDRLTALGTEPDDIAGRLLTAGARGQRYSARHCPISTYLTGHTDLRLTATDTARDVIFAWLGSLPTSVDTPPPIQLFIRAFDRGRYPYLVIPTQGWQADIEGSAP